MIVGSFLAIAMPHSYCRAPEPHSERVQAVYDAETGALQKLIYDGDGNGTPDGWSYMEGTAVVRIELDRDEDGIVERWEYYDRDRQLQKIGIASGSDGTVDTWVYPGPAGSFERVERSTRRDGAVDRTEYYEQGVIARAEQDVDGDGRIDRWETYDGGVLASVAFDTDGTGSPDQRLLYGRDGSLQQNERLAPAGRSRH